jgi:hypothetical protein
LQHDDIVLAQRKATHLARARKPDFLAVAQDECIDRSRRLATQNAEGRNHRAVGEQRIGRAAVSRGARRMPSPARWRPFG